MNDEELIADARAAQGAAPQADALPSNRENCPGNEGHAGCGEFCSMCYLTTAAPSSGVDEDKLAEELESCLEAGSFDNGDTSEPIWFTDDVKALAAHLAEWLDASTTRKGQGR